MRAYQMAVLGLVAWMLACTVPSQGWAEETPTMSPRGGTEDTPTMSPRGGAETRTGTTPPSALARGATRIAPGAAIPEGGIVGTVKGTNVNVRVGPRVDGHPILKLQEGDVVVIIEVVPDWYGVLIPHGVPAAVATRYATPINQDMVRIDADKLNLRVMPPSPGGVMPPAYRDHPKQGQRLSVIRAEGDWTWVVAPEHTRAYIHAKFVNKVGPVAEHQGVIQKARAKRDTWIKELTHNRMSRRVARAGDALRDAVGDAQEGLYGLRLRGGFDRAPLVLLANALDASRERYGLAPARLRKLASSLRVDIESEMTVRDASRDANVARSRGLSPDPAKLPAPTVSSVTLSGVLRWEPVPRWRNGGAWILWIQDKPTHVVRLTTGMPLPLPDLKAHAGKRVNVQGRQPGEREFGLPVIELRTLQAQ